MLEILDQYFKYLKNIRKFDIDQIEEQRIFSKITRMRSLANDRIGKSKTGKEFLLGIDNDNKYTRTVKWTGRHNNIFDVSEKNIEMRELIEHLKE